MNLDIKILEQSIENILSQSALPAEVKRLVLAEAAGRQAALSDCEIKQQIAAEQQKGGEAGAESVQ